MVASREALRDRGYAERGSTVVHSSTLRLCTAPRACIPNLIVYPLNLLPVSGTQEGLRIYSLNR